MVRRGWAALLLVLVAAPAQAATPVPRSECVDGAIALFDVRLAGSRTVRIPVGGTTTPGALGSSLWDAASRFGLVLDDRSGSAVSVRAEPGCEQTPWWGGIDAYAQLRGFPWARLRVIAQGSAAMPNPTV